MLPIIDIGDFGVSVFALVVIASTVLCWAIAIPRLARLGYPTTPVYIGAVLCFPVSALGAHAGVIMAEFLSGRITSADGSGGITILGAMVVGIGWAWGYTRFILQESPLKLMDAVAFACPLGIALGRIGCMLHGCCYGILTTDAAPQYLQFLTVPITAYEPQTPAWHAHMTSAGHAVWNVPLLLSLSAVVTLWVTERAYRAMARNKRPHGWAVAVMLCTHSTGRFLVDFLRDEPAISWGPISVWQVWALIVACLCGGWLLWKKTAPC